MDKKIYSKFTKERKEEFQIETQIYKSDEGRYIIKRPLSTKSYFHVNHMYETYRFFCDKGISNLTQCQLCDDGVLFEYQDGKSLCTMLLEYIKDKNEAGFYRILQYYKDITESFVLDDQKFSFTDEFRKIFGEYPVLEKLKASRYLNIDTTFDNVMINHNNEMKIIDYEWVFDFAMPVRFVHFRAVNNLCIKYKNELEGFISRDKMMEFFQIDSAEEAAYLEMDKNFVEYVYGSDNSYNNILNQYAKSNIDIITQLALQEPMDIQIYFDYGDGFTEEKSQHIKLPIMQNRVIGIIAFPNNEKMLRIRIDPGMKSIAIKDFNIYYYNDDENMCMGVALCSNASYYENGVFIFDKDDPWIELCVEDMDIQYARIEFDILLCGNEEALAFYQRVYVSGINEAKSDAHVKENELNNRIKEIEQLNKDMSEQVLRLEGEKSGLGQVILDLEKRILEEKEQSGKERALLLKKIEGLENMIKIYLDIKHSLEKQINELSNECRCLRKDKI